ncbi:hypothetical protein [Rubinisphaera margarita]|uniref:hypothetical protein n=1 Tax=Rubinisphaera margarita TaxID=2909586 RepID=UPI001EE862D0|nr:hypothetical protein [Rubinisphaera margarita]MCG6158342.1 hypothetical protein [Rubinisphaera margarita]
MRNSGKDGPSDFLEYLRKNVEYQEMMQGKEREWREWRRSLDADEKELVAKCHAAGHPIKSVWDFVNMEESYATAIPILAEHLEKKHQPRVREGIVRALSTPEAWGVAPPGPLIRLFRDESDPESEMKWLLGAAIAHTATLAEAHEVCELMEDDENGRSREFLPLALVHCPRLAALAILEPLVGHPVMGESAVQAINIVSR